MSDNHLKTPLARSLEKLASKNALAEIKKTGQSLPCSVSAVISSGIVRVKFEVQSSTFTLPEVTVPIVGSRYVRFPTQVGDKGLVIAADARLGGVSGLGTGAATFGQQAANLTALAFVWLGNTNWVAVDDDQAVTIMGPNGVTLRNDAAGVSFVLTPDGVVINGDVTINGNATFNGTIHATGDVQLDSDLTVNGDSLLGTGAVEFVKLEGGGHATTVKAK